MLSLTKNMYKNILNKIKSSRNFFIKKETKVILEDDIVFGFWKDVKAECESENRPMMVLAPMADVTDVAFRYMLNKYGKPDVTWTEFVSCDGLMSPGREVLGRDLEYSEMERPVVAQLFTSNPQNMEDAVKLCLELGFDGVDINMGCPVNVIGKQGAGAKLITEPKLAAEIIRAAQRGAMYFDPTTGDHIKEKSIPVSVKTRLGFNKIEYKTWLPAVLECGIPTLSLHMRTRKEMSKVPAHFELIDEVYDLVKKLSPSTNLIINGDIKNVAQANDMYKKHKMDGAMIGRGVFGMPWAFNQPQDMPDINLATKLEIMLEHTKLFEEKLGDIKSFAIMKKHYKAYVNGFDGAADLRALLFEANNYDEVEAVVRNFLKNL